MRCPYCGAEIEKSILKRVICMQCFHWVDVQENLGQETDGGEPKQETAGIEYQIEHRTAVVSAYHGTDSRVVIADKYGPYRVTEIKERAFADNRQIRELIIPGTVETIGREAFCNCIYLKEVSLGDGVRRIDEGAFYHCVSLEKVEFARIPSAAVSAFSGCYNLPSEIKNKLYLRD